MLTTLIEDRSPAFWQAVNDHPDVKPFTSFGRDADIGPFVSDPRVRPLRTDHGGIMLVTLDGAAQVVELHLMFRPEGRGRPALQALREAVSAAFADGAQIITTYQVDDASHWKPPASFGFICAGDYQPLGDFGVAARSWALTKLAWENSPARRGVH